MANTGGNITQAEWNTFDRLTREEIIDIMYLYLVSGKFRDMKSLADYYYDNEMKSQYVSLIMRAYNFTGQNGGRYITKATKEDIVDFVDSYPDGIRYWETNFDEFLKERHSYTNNSRNSFSGNNQRMNITEYYEEPFYQPPPNIRTNKPMNLRQYNVENDISQNKKSVSSLDDEAETIVYFIIGSPCLFVILALIFDWFGWRTAILNFIWNLILSIIPYAILIAILVIIIKLIFRKKQ